MNAVFIAKASGYALLVRAIREFDLSIGDYCRFAVQEVPPYVGAAAARKKKQMRERINVSTQNREVVSTTVSFSCS